jgi:hypothetical protein
MIAMIVVKQKGNFANTERFLRSATKLNIRTILEKYGREGVNALSSATPIDTGLTSRSWDYEIKMTNSSFVISWTNSNVVKGVPIAIILQYGHGTRNGGYVQGRDYINPAIRPIFDKISEEIWREVKSL